MKVSSMVGLGVAGVAGIGVLLSALSLNEIPTKDEIAKQKWSNLESAYQSRMDKIPQLVSVVQGSVNAETKMMVEVIKQRSEGLKSQVNVDIKDSSAVQKFSENQNALTTALANMKVVMERYPDPKFARNFVGLMSEVSGIENRIRVARNDYNAAATNLNIYIRTFPGVVGNMMIGVKPAELFKADEGARKAPSIDFGK